MLCCIPEQWDEDLFRWSSSSFSVLQPQHPGNICTGCYCRVNVQRHYSSLKVKPKQLDHLCWVAVVVLSEWFDVQQSFLEWTTHLVRQYRSWSFNCGKPKSWLWWYWINCAPKCFLITLSFLIYGTIPTKKLIWFTYICYWSMKCHKSQGPFLVLKYSVVSFLADGAAHCRFVVVTHTLKPCFVPEE